jgi:endonuclease YncB( thermonuclease family)
MIRRFALALSVLIFAPDHSGAADLPNDPSQSRKASPNKITGHVAVVDGRTLWFADQGILVRLSEIDSCDLPQWAFAPGPNDNSGSLPPVPCGALAKAWLKRSIGSRAITCRTVAVSASDAMSGICQAGHMDLAREMLRVGLARLTTAFPSNPRDFETQRHAVRARYGMWATYVLDMTEWRQKAVDKTLGRKPLADINLLSERRSEISPPFADARRQPSRRDR